MSSDNQKNNQTLKPSNLSSKQNKILSNTIVPIRPNKAYTD